MQAIREIITAGADTVTVNIPEEFRDKQVEIIVLPYPGTDKLPNNPKTDKLKQFDQLVENAKKRNLQIDKNINIDNLMNEMNNGLC